MLKSTSINRQGVEWILQQPLDLQLEVLSNHLDICKAVINSVLQAAVEQKAGRRYCRVKPHEGQYSRWGVNPGSVRMGNQKLSVAVPRVVDNHSGAVDNIEAYAQLRDLPEQKEEMVLSVLKGLSTRDYSGVATQVLDSFGLSPSSISRHFVEYSARAVEEFARRMLDEEDYVALFIDGKPLAGEQMIIVLGITAEGVKRPLDVVQATTENHRPIKEMLASLIARGLHFERGLLVITDGGKGIRKAVELTFGSLALIQRCQWHKRENILGYLGEEQQGPMRKALQQAYCHSDYHTAKAALLQVAAELRPLNLKAHNSLLEGLEETLTLQRLGVHKELGKSFATTNCIESLNSQIEKYTRKVKHWMHSDQRHRWVTMALLEAEKNMHKVQGYKHLHRLQEALEKEINSKNTQSHSLQGASPLQRISTKNAT